MILRVAKHMTALWHEIGLAEIGSASNSRKKLDAEDYKEVTPERRSLLQTAQQLALARDLVYEETYRCHVCSMVRRGCCFCPEIDQVAKVLRQGHVLGFKIVIYMHCTELARYRASNTGKLIVQACDQVTEFVVSGIESEEKRVFDQVFRDSSQVFVLFPSPDAKDFNTEVSKSSEEKVESGKIKTIVLLDGTWPSAQSMHRRLLRLYPEIPRFKLSLPAADEESGSDSKKHKIRKHGGEPERMSTLHTFVEVVRRMNPSNVEAAEALKSLIKIQTDNYHKQMRHDYEPVDVTRRKEQELAENSSK